MKDRPLSCEKLGLSPGKESHDEHHSEDDEGKPFILMDSSDGSADEGHESPDVDPPSLTIHDDDAADDDEQVIPVDITRACLRDIFLYEGYVFESSCLQCVGDRVS
jgi:hypothetical protein